MTCVFNPQRYRSRFQLYKDFARYVPACGGVLHTAEVAYGADREHGLWYDAPVEVARPSAWVAGQPQQVYLKLRTAQDIWLKENALNLLLARVLEANPDADKFAIIDADVAFDRPDWVAETIHMLQRYPVVQMFRQAIDLGPKFEPLQFHKSFAACLYDGEPLQTRGGYYYGGRAGAVIHWHPGYAWAWRRAALDGCGQFVDFAILGAADNHMAHALIGEVDRSVHPDVHASYRRKLNEWQERALVAVRKKVGVMDGTLKHYWHGKKVDRRYWDRWKIIVDNQFDPDAHLSRDTQGLLQLVDRGDDASLRIRDQSIAYYASRNEDSVDVE